MCLNLTSEIEKNRKLNLEKSKVVTQRNVRFQNIHSLQELVNTYSGDEIASPKMSNYSFKGTHSDNVLQKRDSQSWFYEVVERSSIYLLINLRLP